MYIDVPYKVDIRKGIMPTEMKQPLYFAEENAHRITVTLVDGLEDINLNPDVECNAHIIVRNTNQTIIGIAGEIEANDQGHRNICTVVLPKEAYYVAGPINVVINLVEGLGTDDQGNEINSVTTILSLNCTVRSTITGTEIIVDGSTIESLDDLLAQIQQLASDIEDAQEDLDEILEDVDAVVAPKIADAVAKSNSRNYALAYGDFSGITHQNVTFTWNSDHNVCTMNSTATVTATAGAYNIFMNYANDLCGMEIGKSYYFDVHRTRANTGVQVYFYINGTLSTATKVEIYEPRYVTVPANATGIYCRVFAAKNTTAMTNETVSVEIYRPGNKAPIADPYLTPTGDTTDRASEITAVLNTYKSCVLAPGEYYVSNIVMPSDTALKGSGSGDTKLIMISGETGACVSLGTRCDVSDISLYGQDTAAYTENAERHAIGWTGTFVSQDSPGIVPLQGMVSNLYIEGFKGAAIYCNATSMQTYSGIQVNNVTAFKCWAGIYIKKYSEFNQFTNFRSNYCTYGCINNGGNNIFTNCNFSRTGTCLLMDDTDTQAPNNSHGSYIGCVFDHSGINGSGYENNSGYSIILIGLDNGEMFSGCQIFYGKTQITDCVGIRFVGCNYGRNTNLEISNSEAISFDSCVFRSNASGDTQLSGSGNTGLTFTHCLQYDGSVFDPNSSDTTVRYISQTLTDEQKTQARTNIGAIGSSDVPTGVVRYDEAQEQLTNVQKTQARANILAERDGVLSAVCNAMGVVDYNYGTDTQSLTYNGVTITRTGMRLTFNGTDTSPADSYVRLMIGSSIFTKTSGGSSGDVSSYGVVLDQPNVYMICLHLVSGTAEPLEDRMIPRPSATASNTSTSGLSDNVLEVGGSAYREYTNYTGNGKVLFSLIYQNGTKFTNAVYDFFIIDTGSMLSRSMQYAGASLAVTEQPVATAAHAVEDLIMVNGRLCKVTSAIAIGDNLRFAGSSKNCEPASVDSLFDRTITDTVTGATPSITAAANHRYECTGTVRQISITPPASGLCEVTFTTGSSPVWDRTTGAVMPSWFTGLESNRHYEMSFDGSHGVVTSWAT